MWQRKLSACSFLLTRTDKWVAPSLHFLLAVFVFGEIFDAARGTTFAFIWLALLIYTADALHQHRLRTQTDTLP